MQFPYIATVALVGSIAGQAFFTSALQPMAQNSFTRPLVHSAESESEGDADLGNEGNHAASARAQLDLPAPTIQAGSTGPSGGSRKATVIERFPAGLLEQGTGVAPALDALGLTSLNDLWASSKGTIATRTNLKVLQTDVRPFVALAQLLNPATGKHGLILAFEGERLYHLGTDWSSDTPVEPGLTNFLGAPERALRFAGGGALLEWKLPEAWLRVYTAEPNDKDREWWLYPLDHADDHRAEEERVFEAFALNDGAEVLARPEHASPEDLAKSAAQFRRATELVPAYGRAWLRLCRLQLRMGLTTEAAASCQTATNSVFPDVKKQARKLMSSIP